MIRLGILSKVRTPSHSPAPRPVTYLHHTCTVWPPYAPPCVPLCGMLRYAAICCVCCVCCVCYSFRYVEVMEIVQLAQANVSALLSPGCALSWFNFYIAFAISAAAPPIFILLAWLVIWCKSGRPCRQRASKRRSCARRCYRRVTCGMGKTLSPLMLAVLFVVYPHITHMTFKVLQCDHLVVSGKKRTRRQVCPFRINCVCHSLQGPSRPTSPHWYSCAALL